VENDSDVALAIEQLATLGYKHLGNLGIEGREAFDNSPGLPSHHLYVCPRGSLGLRNHLAVRDYLRCHPDAANSYGELKRTLTRQHRNDIDAYVDGKTNFILEILAKTGLAVNELESFAAANRKD